MLTIGSGLYEAFRVYRYFKFGEKTLYWIYQYRIKLVRRLQGEQAAEDELKYLIDNWQDLHVGKSIAHAVIAFLASAVVLIYWV
jgi:hypothetical protein